MATAFVLLVAVVACAAADVSFVTIGDWGGSTIDAEHKQNQALVAKALGQAAAKLNAKFVINTGDNFYYYGVNNISDPQFKTDFEDVYTASSLMVPWYGVLGNHDYAFNVTAQLVYKSPNNDRWVLPSRYYTKRIQLSPTVFATFVFIDTSPCQKEFRSDDPKNWDPCGPDYPHPTPCDFHKHVIAQSCQDQYAWLQKTLATVPASDWLIGVGHAPAFEIDVEDLTSLLQGKKMDLYLNGHTHVLEQYTVNGSSAFVTSGAGAMVETHDQELLAASLVRRDIGSQFYQKTAGFTTHTFSADFSELTTTFVSYESKQLHSFTVKRGVTPPPPPPPSPSSGLCANYGCGSYEKDRPCHCNSSCEKYNDCCSDYQKVCH